jgi:hypothetical protein
VALEVQAGAVVPHDVAWVGVPGGDLHVAQGSRRRRAWSSRTCAFCLQRPQRPCSNDHVSLLAWADDSGLVRIPDGGACCIRSVVT